MNAVSKFQMERLDLRTGKRPTRDVQQGVVKIQILDESQEDLIAGFRFYETQELGLGSYFLDCLFSDIASLILYAVIHQIIFGHYRCLTWEIPFLLSIIASRKNPFAYMPCWMIDGIRCELENL